VGNFSGDASPEGFTDATFALILARKKIGTKTQWNREEVRQANVADVRAFAEM